MQPNKSTDVLVIGGGLAGLVTALQLSGQGAQVTVVEKKLYPFHKVCGEYVSNEVLPYLKELNIHLSALGPAQIQQFHLSSPTGKSIHAPLDLGGFGVSRYRLDHHLYTLAQQQGAVFLHTTATAVSFANDRFTVTLANGQEIEAKVVVGAYGKRSALDRKFNRLFFEERSPYLAVKYHLRAELPRSVISLHNFRDGYAGISAIEEDKFCFCYLTTRHNLKKHGTIAALQEHELSRNPFLKNILNNSEFIYTQPEVINEISFAPKACVEDHVLMCGDAAGLITPLCGNGMAMAIHAAKLASVQVFQFLRANQTRQQMEMNYAHQWKRQFETRLRTGRWVQKLFGHPVLSEMAVAGLSKWPGAVQAIVKRTHGKPF